MKKIFLKKNHGFTMVETLVAVSILSISILAGFTAVQNGLKSSINVKNQITAYYLVQEAIELLKNKRDENALNFLHGNSNTWLTGMSACNSPSFCYIDSHTAAITSCSGGNSTCPNLRMDNTTRFWGYNGSWSDTIFKRAITFQTVSVNEVAVTVWISWVQGGATKTFQVTENIFNRLQ